MKRTFLMLLVAVLAISMLVMGCPPAEEPLPEEPDPWAEARAFYRGKTVHIHTAVPGSGMDIMSRYLADHLKKALNATVVVTAYYGMGGLDSYNELWDRKDLTPRGLHIGGHSLTTVWQNTLLGTPVRYKSEELIYLGSVLCPPMCLWTNATRYANITALLATIPSPVRMGRGSPVGYIAIWGGLAGRWLGLNQTIVGVGGPGPLKAALLRDEIEFTNISIHWTETYGVPLYPDLKPVLMLDDKPYDLYDRWGVTKIATIPALTAYANITPAEQHWFTLMKYAGLYNMPGLAFPPGVEQYKVDFMRKVLNDIANDPAVIDDARARFGEWAWHNATQVEAAWAHFVANNASLWQIKSVLGL